MSQSASSSKTAVIAGTLAGLLAAGLAGYYWHAQPAVTAPVAAVATASATASAAAPAATAPKAGARSKEQALADLMSLPELQAWSACIEQQSAGKSHGAVIEYDPEPMLIEGKSYWQLSFVENTPEAAHRWESFLVAQHSTEILVEDLIGDELLSLDRWRKEKRPMQRSGAQ
ncbi:hypothetical protein [Janthinobacterium agaricidamnosum]|uniref:Uncharacterized protein n=1 Tax=Janthinobacterium agaricidamnosum NBRC 102515 = DSM 9628 TaxID=1349767 RepID=W0V2Z2_9BURK|nr:hypothetical protein [Janthinobacterium agaricidamnosum]CDG81728.1 hypothetical protein GJA_1073 [Janthinobacterium agaricidamnosum NBRC 102515 = DSM 9628]